MLKKSKIYYLLILFLIVFFIFFTYFILKIKIIKVGITPDQANNMQSKKTVEKHILSQDEINNLKIKYNEEFTFVTEEYFKILNNPDISDNKENLDKLRERMLALVVPEEYKKTHLELVLIFSKMNDLLRDNDFKEAQKLLAEAKDRYLSLKKS